MGVRPFMLLAGRITRVVLVHVTHGETSRGARSQAWVFQELTLYGSLPGGLGDYPDCLQLQKLSSLLPLAGNGVNDHGAHADDPSPRGE